MKEKLKKILPAPIWNGSKRFGRTAMSGIKTLWSPIIRASGRLIRNVHAPKLPKRSDGKVLIHLGCGNQNIPGYINIDIEARPHIHYVCNVRKLEILPDDYADLIYASHILEHVGFAESEKVLREWCRVLKQNGTLRLAVPDFNFLVRQYQSSGDDIEKIQMALLGSHDYDYNSHKSIFDTKYLTKLLTNTGFGNIRKWEARTGDNPFSDFAKTYKGSLNIEADKIL